MGFKEIGDKINEATDTGNSWINDPKNKSSVGALTVVLIIVFLGIICRSSSKNTTVTPSNRPQQTAQAKSTAWESLDKLQAAQIWAKIKDSTLIEGMTYKRIGEYSITYNFKFKFNEMTVNIPTEEYRTLIRTWCIAIAKAYNNGQYIYLNAIMHDTTIANAEYSPLSGKVKVQ